MPNYGKSSNSISNSKEDYFDMGGIPIFPQIQNCQQHCPREKETFDCKGLAQFFSYIL